MQPSQQRSQRPVGATSWVQMSAANPTLSSNSQAQESASTSSKSSRGSNNLIPSATTTANSYSSFSSSSSYTSNQQAESAMISGPGSLSSASGHQQRYSSSSSGSQRAGSLIGSLHQQMIADLVGESPGDKATGGGGDEDDELQREREQEENRKLRLQLYVFVLRCISYSFNAKQTGTGAGLHLRHQQVKLRKSELEQIVQLHTRYVNAPQASFAPNKCPHQHLKLGAAQLRQLDELYERVHLIFNRKFLHNERMRLFVESECCSQQDLRQLFKQVIEKTLKESTLFVVAHQQQQQQQHLNRQRQLSSGLSQMTLDNQNATTDTGNSAPTEPHNALLLNKDVIINSWLIKFESIIREESDANQSGADLAVAAASAANQQLSKEQLYQMFQNILNIKKFEHQLLYNALQLDSADEQAAAVRRELDGRIARIAELERNKKLMPKFVLKEMESLHLEESRMAVNKLMVNLDRLPVTKGGGGAGGSGGVSSVGYGLQKFRRYNNRGQATLTRDGLAESHPSEPSLTKLDVVLTFNIEVIVMEVRGLRHLASNREIYCTMEIEGSERLQTEHALAKKPLWDTQGDFTTNHPLPVLKIKLYAVNPSIMSLEDKELGKLVLRPTVLSPKTPEWCTMQASASSTSSSGAGQAANSSSGAGNNHHLAAANQDQELKIRVIVRMDRPQQLKHCGYLWGIGKSTWRKLKRRYHILIQVSQYTFVMCSYRDKKAKPTEMLQLDGYTVDYIEPPTDLIMEHCSEITSSSSHQHHSSAHHSGGSVASPLGLAGMLANKILKQPTSSSSSSLAAAAAAAASSANSPDADEQTHHQAGDQATDNPHQSAIQTAAALSDELHSKYYFNVVREGDSVVFACDDEQECFGWVMALYRATGQAHKPSPLRSSSSSSAHYVETAFAYQSSLTQQTKLVGNNTANSNLLNGTKGKSSVDQADQRARKHGMDEFIAADPCKFQHNHLFAYLQNETLKYRLNDQFCSLGWFAPGQVLVLDEYCARYGVRTCFRHLAYLNSLLDFNQRGYFIDHTLLNYGYDFCASHVSGNSGQAHPIGSVNFDLRPDGIGTVTVEERDMFHVIKSKLLKMIERQIANFSYCFPFGKPDGALKATLSLLERVLMKEQQTTNSMLQNEEVRNLIKKCLEQAALNSYTKLSGQANLLDSPAPPANNETSLSSPTPGAISDNQQQISAQAGGGCGSPGGQLADGETTEQKQQQQQAISGGGGGLAGRFYSRTSSNLSNSSTTSYASSTVSSSKGAAQSCLSGTNAAAGSPFAAQDSVKRRGVVATPARIHHHQQQQQIRHPQCLTMAMIINNEHIRAKDKLRYLIRLAELCCEQVEESNEYFSDAFAWHSDLMMDHYELFWSLFSVDMDKIINELNSQQQQQHHAQSSLSQTGHQTTLLDGTLTNLTTSGGARQASSTLGPASELLGAAGNREVFALFEVLNNHMRKDPNLLCRKFEQYLCDTFKPRLLRYIDIMESTLTRMLFKACDKDCQVNFALIEQMFLRLDDLQRFVLNQLCWPDNQLADQLLQRLKLIAYELCDACVQRTLQAFQQSERKSNKWTATTTSYSNPVDMIQMINLVLETRNRSFHLCTFNNFDQMSYHSKIDKLVETALAEMQPGLMAKMIYALESTLSKLARYDEGNLLAPILSLTYKQGMSASGRDVGKQYVKFVSNCCELLRQKINDELWIVNLLEKWYEAQMSTICNWLAERMDHSLHDVQLAALTTIMPKIYADMSLQGVTEDKLNLKTHQTIMSRLKMEEAASSATGNLYEQPNSTSIFNSSILSSLTSSSSAASGSMPCSTAGATSPTPPPTTPNHHHQSTIRQPLYSGQQQVVQQRPGADSPIMQSRRAQQQLSGSSFGSNNNNDSPIANGGAQEEADNNIADRAIQSATRMFKGFWAS